MNQRAAMQRFYTEHPRMVSSPFGGVDGINRDLLLDVLARLNISFDRKRVVDIGCGRGFLGDIVREHGGTYTGMDLVASRGGFPLALADAGQLPVKSEAADIVCCIDASEHFPDPAAAAAEFHRILKPGGVFFLSAPNYGNVAGLVKWLYEAVGWAEKNSWAPFGRWQPQECEHTVTRRGLTALYRAAGFSNIQGIGHGVEVGLGVFPWVDHPRTPEAIQFRLQRLFAAIGPAWAARFPGASLHLFWRMEK